MLDVDGQTQWCNVNNTNTTAEPIKYVGGLHEYIIYPHEIVLLVRKC